MKAKKKAYKKRLIRSNVILLLLSSCILLFTSYYTIRKIYTDNVVKTYVSQLNGINIQVQSAGERIKMLTEAVVQNDSLLQMVEQLAANGEDAASEVHSGVRAPFPKSVFV